MNGVMSKYSGNAINEEIFLWKRLECSKRCRYSQVRRRRRRNSLLTSQFNWECTWTLPSSGNWQRWAISSSSIAWWILDSSSSGSIWSWPTIPSVLREWIAPGNRPATSAPTKSRASPCPTNGTNCCGSPLWSWERGPNLKICPRTGRQSSRRRYANDYETENGNYHVDEINDR